MSSKIKNFFKTKKTIKKIKKENKDLPYAEKLVADTCRWVNLYWSGQKRNFLIHKIDFIELLISGRFPNVLYRLTKGLTEILNEDTPEIPEVELKKMADEEEIFMQELVKRSLVEPTYKELEEATKKQLKYLEDDAIFFKTIIPEDFTKDLFLWYVKNWEETLKKKSDDVILNASGELLNTGNLDQATTLKI
ncbi:MAG: hypothetical protein CR988_02400 [Treponema sp.]|nr:MAG: hypothetical protein CR988_02400 [Treponema sp.]